MQMPRTIQRGMKAFQICILVCSIVCLILYSKTDRQFHRHFSPLCKNYTFMEKIKTEFREIHREKTKSVEKYVTLGPRPWLNESMHKLLVNLRRKAKSKTIKAGKYTFFYNPKTFTYDVDGKKPVIWLFWHDRSRMPDYIKIFAESIKCVNKEFEVILVDDDTIHLFWPKIHKNRYDLLIPAHRSDVFRVQVLKTFGGLYLDVDTYALQSMYVYYKLLTDYDLFGTDYFNQYVARGHFGPVRAGSMLFTLMAQAQQLILERHLRLVSRGLVTHRIYPMEWTTFLQPSQPLTAQLLEFKHMRYYCTPYFNSIGQGETMGLTRAMNVPLAEFGAGVIDHLTETPILYNHHSWLAEKMRQIPLRNLMLNNQTAMVYTYFNKCALKSCFSRSADDRRKKPAKTSLTRFNVSFLQESIALGTFFRCNRWNQTVLPKSESCSMFDPIVGYIS